MPFMQAFKKPSGCSHIQQKWNYTVIFCLYINIITKLIINELWLNISQKKNYIDVFSKIYDLICVHLQVSNINSITLTSLQYIVKTVNILDFYIIEMNQWKKWHIKPSESYINTN